MERDISEQEYTVNDLLYTYLDNGEVIQQMSIPSNEDISL